MKTQNGVLGIDPGNSGAFVWTDGKHLKTWPMPITQIGKDKEVNFFEVQEILKNFGEGVHVWIERAMPMAMGSKHAFNYGRGFAALQIALSLGAWPVTYIEPQKWTKEMHEGISQDLRPKARSLIAVKRLYPRLVPLLPRNTKGTILDGPVDALLIAGYGLRRIGSPRVSKRNSSPVMEDFY